MKTNIISKLLFSLSLAFVLGSAITQVRGDTDSFTPVFGVHSTGDVTRGKTGSFVVARTNVAQNLWANGATYVNVSFGGTAVAGVDYVVTSVAPYIVVGKSGYGVISIRTLPNRRALAGAQKYSVVVNLEDGPGYSVGAHKSATMWIEPCTAAAGCQ